MKNKNENCVPTPEMAMKVLKVIGMVLLGIAAAFLFGLVIMLLWNWLMPDIFSLPSVNYWQGLGLLVLASILFGRFGGGSEEKKKEKRSHPIKDEIKKEIEKELEKEYGKKASENASYEKAYEAWWEKEGKASFEKFSKRDEDK